MFAKENPDTKKKKKIEKEHNSAMYLEVLIDTSTSVWVYWYQLTPVLVLRLERIVFLKNFEKVFLFDILISSEKIYPGNN